MQDNYLDAYVSVLKEVDPMSTSLVFNCGMGVVRSESCVESSMLNDDPAYEQLHSECVLHY